jgi:hypothetical protein
MKLIKEPLFQFVILGIALFAVYAVASDRLASNESATIRLTPTDVELLSATFERQWQRPPVETELENLIKARVREEVLYREALAVGLDTNDMVVRRRMVQKMEMLSQNLALLADPTDNELQAYFDTNSEEYRVPPEVSFSHIYFNADNRGDAVEADALAMLAELRAQDPPPARAPERGDRFMLGHDFRDAPPSQVARSFGQQFADAVVEFDTGWQGPVASGYGLHLVYIEKRVDGRIPNWTEVRDRLVMDFNRTRTERSKEALYEGLLAKYEVEIAGEPVPRSALETSGPTTS